MPSRFSRKRGDFFQATWGGCPHPPGWGLFSRSRRESAFTHLSFRGAPRREPAFKYLSFRIRFSGEESAFCRGAPFFRAFCERVGTFPLSRTESAFTYLSIGGAPRLEPAFIYLSFRIRFSGEESAFCRGAHPFAFFAKGWGLFSRSRTESAFTYLSFRGAPRREPAFKYLSFRIRFSGEESAVQRADRNDSRGAPGSRCLCETWDGKNCPFILSS